MQNIVWKYRVKKILKEILNVNLVIKIFVKWFFKKKTHNKTLYTKNLEIQIVKLKTQNLVFKNINIELRKDKKKLKDELRSDKKNLGKIIKNIFNCYKKTYK